MRVPLSFRRSVFYKLGKPVADKIITEREGRLQGKSEWDETETEGETDTDVSPFSEKTPKPV